MSENVPTTDEAARAEAEASYPASLAITRYERAAFIHGWNSHAVWQLSHPVEVTDEMVERAAKALHWASPVPLYYEKEDRAPGSRPWEWLSPEYRAARRDDARSALRAALEGETE